MRAKMVVPKAEAELIQNLLSLTGNEIYDKYGLHRHETITRTVILEDGAVADIRLIIDEDEEIPYTEGILFIDGFAACVTDPQDTYDGEWYFEYRGEEYYVDVVFEEDTDREDREYSSFFVWTDEVQRYERHKNP